MTDRAESDPPGTAVDPAPPPAPRPEPRILDSSPGRLRHPRDLIVIVLALLGIGLVLALSVYAHGTTNGLASDVREFASVLSRILVLPVALLEVLVMFGIPLAVLTQLGAQRLGRQVVDSLVAAASGLLLAYGMTWAISEWGAPSMLVGLSIRTTAGAIVLTIPAYVSGIVALLTLAGPASRRRTVRWSWNVLWAALVIVLILGQVAVPGVLLTLLVGRLAGVAVRYLLGVRSERATGAQMVESLRGIGLQPLTLARVRDVVASSYGVALASSHEGGAGSSNSEAGAGHADSRSDPAEPMADIRPSTQAIEATARESASVTIARYSSHRVYALTTAGGPRLDVVVLDGDRQVVGWLARMWRSVRYRGIEARSGVSLRAVAERSALLAYAAESAGVRTPRLLGVCEAADSMLLVQEHTSGSVSLRDLPDEALTDEVIAELWHQLATAHAHGLTHRALTSDVVLVREGDDETGPRVWLTGWDQGDVAATEFSRLMDVAQLLALLALRVGVPRSIAGAVDAGFDLTGVGPMLQTPTMPRETREQLRVRKQVLPDLRESLVERLPRASVEPKEIRRFKPRTIIMMTLTVIAFVVIVTTVNFGQIRDALLAANPWWMVVSFGFGLLTWIGAALVFVAFAPVKVPFNRAVLVQAASSFIALAAPAGIGPAALNLRLLTQRKVATSLAVATVALVQVSQFVVTVLVLVALSVTTGDGSVLRSLPSGPVLGALGGAALVVALSLTVAPVRRWVVRKTRPTIDQVWPRLSAVLGQPLRLLTGFAGNVIISLAYVLAFDAALAAFGQHISLIDAAVIYLIGNAVGASVPTPGGIGAIELALITGLTTTAGIGAGIATSAVVLFRLATYWARIPLGWGAMTFLQRRHEL